jgi:signal transduction histidine kinase
LESTLEMTELEGLFTRERQITVYRIVQECLTNIAKHAQASHVSVTVTKQDDLFFFRVEDNGKGFDVDEVLDKDPRTKGLGLAAMYERTRMLKGSLDIWSQKGAGTLITFTVALDDGGSRL